MQVRAFHARGMPSYEAGGYRVMRDVRCNLIISHPTISSYYVHDTSMTQVLIAVVLKAAFYYDKASYDYDKAS
jgi:hypothetical protein